MERDMDLETIRERRRQRAECQDEYGMGYEEDEAERSGDSLLRLTLLQTLVCALIVALVFLLGKTGAQSFTALREVYWSVMAVDLDAKEMFAALRDASRYVIAPADEWRKGTTEQPEDTDVGDGAPDVPQTTVGADDPVRPETEAADDPTGGEDISLPQGTRHHAAANTSLAPVYTTMAPRPAVTGRISSPFGYRIHPITGKESFHTGLDLAAPEGRPIAAAFAGRVKEVGESETWGNYVLLEHQQGLETFYAHCAEVYVEEGAALRLGEIIALVGTTGLSTGPHLHFELRVNGVRYDPAWILVV